MKLVKVSPGFYSLAALNHVDEEIMFNEAGRPCVLLINLNYKGNLRKFVVPLRSNISSKAPKEQYFSLPPNKSTRPGCHHGVHYIKLFPIEDKYIDKYRVGGEFDKLILDILSDNQDEIISACQKYLNECEKGNKHVMTPNIDGILRVLDDEKT